MTLAQVYRLERFQILPRPLDEVFPFFADARNLGRITPGFLDFEILTEGEIEMAVGTAIDYRIRLFGVPLRWRTRIEVYEPGIRFVDVQIRGPYRLWRHEHLFREVTGGVQMTDRVDYSLPFDPLGRLAHPVMVRPALERIFDFRRETLEEIFGSPS